MVTICHSYVLHGGHIPYSAKFWRWKTGEFGELHIICQYFTQPNLSLFLNPQLPDKSLPLMMTHLPGLCFILLSQGAY